MADLDTTNYLCSSLSNKKICNDNFWKQKCNRIYPNKTFLECFDGYTNFLLKDKTFALFFDDTDDFKIYNLIEYHSILDKQIKTVEDSDIYSYGFIKINVDHQYIVIKRPESYSKTFILYQTNNKDECYNIIKKDAMQETYDCDYYILNICDLRVMKKLIITKGIYPEFFAGSEYNKNL